MKHFDRKEKDKRIYWSLKTISLYYKARGMLKKMTLSLWNTCKVTDEIGIYEGKFIIAYLICFLN